MDKEHITPELMSKLAKTVDKLLNTAEPGKTGFCLFVYPHEPGNIDALYVSNTELEDVKRAVATWLQRSNEDIKPINSNIPAVQAQNELIKARDAITAKYLGKRVLDKDNNEQYDYQEQRDWQAIYHYPDRFEIVGPATNLHKWCAQCQNLQANNTCKVSGRDMEGQKDWDNCGDYKEREEAQNV